MKTFTGDRDGECARRGYGFEAVARRTFESQGYETKDATKHEGIVGHVDFWAKDKHGQWRSIDAKAMKKLSRYDDAPQDEWTFVEWKNNAGYDGWLKKGAEFMAFERAGAVMVVRRSRLHDWAETVVDFSQPCHRSSDAKYKTYSRAGRSDLTSLIKLDDVPVVLIRLWAKV